MRLIDADETIKQYTQIFVEKYGVECGEMFQGVLKQMPTAYDVDKVVEEFEEIQNKAVSVKNEDISIYAVGMMGKAIEIVKGGGK
jgi:hypothetical protein|nr:MAG TPA: hypothetical protein [Caudoviricetes sp.]